MKIRTQETTQIYEEYIYDLEEKHLPPEFGSWNPEDQAEWLNLNSTVIDRLGWEYSGLGSIDDWEFVE